MLAGALLALTALTWQGSAHAAEGVAVADAGAATEEIIVYGDDFARWDDTRWLVATELVLPGGVPFAADRNLSFVSFAFQVRAVVSCNKDDKLGKKKWEVSCEIEDIGLLVSSQRRARREKDREMVEEVLAEIDEKLTGLRVQMQVDFKGGVTNLDLEGIVARNDRQRLIQESLRQIVRRVTAGFHLRIPDHAQREGRWIEYNSELMQLPSATASRGSTTLVHLVTPYEGLQIVQMIGEGTTVASIPVAAAEDSPFGDSSGQGAEISGGGDGGGGFGPVSELSVASPDAGAVALASFGNGGGIELPYSMHATGVAIFDRSNGVMRERVWAAHGFATASAAGGAGGPPFRNVGRLVQIVGDDHPSVGPTTQVALPGKTIEGLPSWIPIDVVTE